METITAADFNECTATGKVVVEFYGNGCLNCQMMTPILNQIEPTFPDVSFYRVNADDHPNLVQKYQVTSLPTLQVFREGIILSTIVGVKSQSTLQNLIDEALNYA